MSLKKQYSSVYQAISDVESRLKDWSELIAVFKQCYPNTLETTVQWPDDGTAFVITGDIPAMWLRDSSAQVRPYVRFAKDDADVRQLIAGLIRRQAAYILIDPYANAFNETDNNHGHQEDHTDMLPSIWERKFEVDSLCYPVQLLKDYWDVTGDKGIFDQTIRLALTLIVETFITEQQHDLQSHYHFERDNCPASDTLPFNGRGTRTNFTGMIWSGFRPSDDSCIFGYLIPANMLAVVILGHIIEFAGLYGDTALAEKANRLRSEVDFGIQTYGMVNHPRFGRMYTYETDGYGNYNLMDDANVPNLLSIPYLGYRPADDPIYANTRAFVLSSENPYFREGQYARGIGSPHTPPGYIWPIGLIMQGLTTTDVTEQRQLIEMLISTTAGTQFMHESFDPDNPAAFTRSWFAWANSLFGEFIYRWALRQ
jgi:meiotically up-regulated gene 157 (Mug157) protein